MQNSKEVHSPTSAMNTLVAPQTIWFPGVIDQGQGVYLDLKCWNEGSQDAKTPMRHHIAFEPMRTIELNIL